MCKYNVRKADMDAVTAITPGKRSPTVMSLQSGNEEWYAVEAMVTKDSSNEVMEALWDAGAKDILMLPLSNTRTED
jgi:ATP phosphoribosyltransferase